MKRIEKKRPVKYPTVEFWQREECEDQWFLSDVEWYSRRFGPMVLSRDGLPFDAVLEVQDKDGENSVLHLYFDECLQDFKRFVSHVSRASSSSDDSEVRPNSKWDDSGRLRVCEVHLIAEGELTRRPVCDIQIHVPYEKVGHISGLWLPKSVTLKADRPAEVSSFSGFLTGPELSDAKKEPAAANVRYAAAGAMGALGLGVLWSLTSAV